MAVIPGRIAGAFVLPTSAQAVGLPTDVGLHVIQRVARPDGSTAVVQYAHAASATAPLTATTLTAGPAFPVQLPERAEVSVHLVAADRAIDAGATAVIIDAAWPALDAVTLHHLIDGGAPSPLLVAGPQGAAAWRMRRVSSLTQLRAPTVPAIAEVVINQGYLWSSRSPRAVRLTDAIAADVLARELGGALPADAHVVVTLDATASLGDLVALVDTLVAAGAVDVELTDRPSAMQRTALVAIDAALAAAPRPRLPSITVDDTGRTARQPVVTLSPAQASDGLAPEIIHRYLRRNLSKFTYCYERELLSRPTIAGTSALSFTIDGTGVVVASHTTGFDPAVDGCVDRVVRGIELPRPTQVDAVRVTGTISFALAVS